MIVGNWYESRLTPQIASNNKHGSRNPLLADVTAPLYETTSRAAFKGENPPDVKSTLPPRLVSKYNVINILNDRPTAGAAANATKDNSKELHVMQTTAHSAFGGKYSDKPDAVNFANTLNNKTPQEKNEVPTNTSSKLLKKKQNELESVASTISTAESYNPLLDDKIRRKPVQAKKTGPQVWRDY